MKYPTIEEVEAATHLQLGWWYRFLGSPENTEETGILNRILARFKEAGGMNPALSKQIGWL